MLIIDEGIYDYNMTIMGRAFGGEKLPRWMEKSWSDDVSPEVRRNRDGI